MRMLSDVPVGVFLSGGIDLERYCRTLADAGHQVHSFSVTFDEKSTMNLATHRPWQNIFQTNHTELRLRSDDILGQFDHALASYDQPSTDGLNSFFIAEEVRRAGIKVALSGLGGDELFAGYPMFQHATNWTIRSCVSLFGLCYLLHDAFGPPVPNFKNWVKFSCGGFTCGSLCSLSSPDEKASLSLAFAQRISLCANALPEDLCSRTYECTRDLDAVNAHSYLEMSLYLQMCYFETPTR